MRSYRSCWGRIGHGGAVYVMVGSYRSWGRCIGQGGGRTGHGKVVQVMVGSYRSWWDRIGHGEVG